MNYTHTHITTTKRLTIAVAVLFMALLAMMAGRASAQTQTFNTTGSFVVPAGVTSVNVQVWGGGGAGGGNTTTNDGAGGGGGGAYSTTNGIVVTPGASLTVTVGTGGTGGTGTGGNGNDSWFINNTTILAKGGNGGFAPVAGAGGVFGTGGAAASGIGTTKFSGGTGGTGRDNGTGQGGPGGSSAGTGANGTTAPAVWSTITAGAAPTGGGQGGDGGNSGNNGEAASTPGGGGGGAGDRSITNRSGGNGAAGRVTITWTCAGYSLASTTVTSPLCAGSTSTVTLTGGTLPDGSYTVTYNRSAPNAATGVTASMTVASGTGSFATAALANAGATTITITNISSGAAGGTCSSAISTNNTAVITVNAAATANAGTLITTCSNAGAINVTTGAAATNNSGVQWASSGSGTFTNGNSITLAEYTPSAADITAGFVTLTMTALGNSPCGNVASASKLLIINAVPVTTANTICQAGSGTVSASSSCMSFTNSGTSIAGAWTAATDPVSNRLNSIDNSATCGFSGSVTRNYVLHQFMVSITGNYIFNMTASSNSDPMGYIYTGAFVPGSCATGTFVRGDDDDGSGNFPRLGQTGVGVGVMPLTAGVTYTLVSTTYSTSSGSISGTFTWTITPPSGGVIVLPNSSSTINWYNVPSGGSVLTTGTSYNPVPTGMANTNTPGTYTFYAACSNNTTCREAVSFVINPAATVSAGTNDVICEGSTFTMNGSFGGAATSATWSTSGSGSFSDNTPTAVYTPSGADITAGSVILTYTTDDPSGPCGAENASMTLTINLLATTNANSDQTICATSTATLNGSIGGGASSASWTTGGDGTFDNANSLGAVYTPGATDITNGTVTLTLTTNDPSGPCAAVNDAMVIIIDQAATVSANVNQTVCVSTGTATLNGSFGGSASSASWTTAGDGTFDNANLLGAVYTFGANDITNGSAVLTLTTDNPANVCGAVSDNVTINIEAIPTANANVDQNTCSAGTTTLNGSVGGSATGGTWTTGGDGTFDNANLLGAVYTPGANDIINGSVVLTLTSTGSVACTADDDQMTITFDNPLSQPSVVSGAPVSVCPPQTGINLSVVNDLGADSYNWYISPGSNGITFSPVSTTNAQTIDLAATTNSTYNIRVEAVNACGASPYRGVSIRRSTSTPAAVIGEGWACANDVKTYSIASVVGATTYQWTASDPGVYFDGNPINTSPYVTPALSVTATFPAVYTTGTVGVAAQVACFTSTIKNLTVNNAPPMVSVITGATSVCAPQSGVAYSVVNTPGLSYTWTPPANATIATGQTTPSVTVNYLAGYSTGQLIATASSACGTSPQRKLNVSVTGGGGGTTTRPVSITGQLSNLCGTTGIILTSNPNTAGATYTFTTNVAGASSVPGPANNQATFTFPTGWTTGTVSVTQQNACATVSPARVVDVKSKPSNPVISGSGAVTTNQSGVVYSIPVLTPAATSITWSVPSGAIITAGQNTASITVTYGANAGSGYVVVNQNNACGNSTGVLPVTISAPRLSGSSKDVADDIKFSVYPNPASALLNLSFNATINGNTTVQLLDLSGKVVAQELIISNSGFNTNTIDVSALAKGMYMLNVQTPDGNLQSRIVVE